MKTTVRLVLFLSIIAALSGLSLGYINGIVEPVIAENNRITEEKNLRAIFPEGEFEEIAYDDPNKIVTAVYRVENQGHVVRAKATGFNTSVPIVLLIGFDEEDTIISIRVLEQQETNGFGSKCFEEENISTLYLGRRSNENIELLSGATFTSKAMVQMIDAARQVLKEVK